jgi:hypothetical protein
MKSCHFAAFLLTSLALLVGACGGSGGPGPSGDETSGVLVAFAANFEGFHQWGSFDVTKDAAPGTVHPDAKLLEYLNKRPPHGSTEFPVGTIVVKEPTTVDGSPNTAPFFAMVKRGGGYNSNGATGWEWFELLNLTDGSGGVQLVWRGVGPPAGEVYGGDPNAGCNSCHQQCGNDAVCAPAVRLTDF